MREIILFSSIPTWGCKDCSRWHPGFCSFSMLRALALFLLLSLSSNAFLVPWRQLPRSPLNLSVKTPLDISFRCSLCPKIKPMILLSALRSAPSLKGSVQSAIEGKVRYGLAHFFVLYQ